MTTHSWVELRAWCSGRFGGDPNPKTDEAIRAVFAVRPAAVTRELQSVAGDVAAGKVFSGWGVALKRVGALDATDTVATDTGERDAAVTRAERWVRGPGRYMPTWDEARDELFGPRGSLRQWPELEGRMQAAWVPLEDAAA